MVDPYEYKKPLTTEDTEEHGEKQCEIVISTDYTDFHRLTQA
jgi:hypothetical protein